MAKQYYQQNIDDFTQYKRSNSLACGKNLVDVLYSIGIDKANINRLKIEAWSDTDCEATKDVLDWFAEYINESNVLTSYENYKYKELRQRDGLLSDNQYEVALSQLTNEKPDILDYDDNCLEVEYLKGELKMDLDMKQRLDKVLAIHENLDVKFTKALSKLTDEEIAYGMEKNKIYQECEELSVKLDESHEKLQCQIGRFANQINEYQTNESNFLSKYDSINCNTFYKIPPLDILLKRERDYFFKLDVTRSSRKPFMYDTKLNVTTKSARKQLLQDNNFGTSSELELLKNRISKSIENCIKIDANNEAAKSEVEFLRDLNVDNFANNYNSMDSSSQMSMQSNIIAHDMIIENSYVTIEKLAINTAEAFISKPKRHTLTKIKQRKQEKLEHLKKIDSKVTSIVANISLLYLLLNKELQDIQTADAFFRNIHYYITTVLHNCQLRIDEMLKGIDEYALYQKLPLEEKLQIFSFVRKILLDDCNDSTPLIDLVRNFDSDCQKTEQQVFYNDYYAHRRISKNFEMCIADLQNVLVNGPTSQIVILTGDVYNCFDQLNDSTNSLEALVKLSVQLMNDADKKISKSKWYKARRHLWMWFMVDPKKLLYNIKLIKSAVTEQSN